MHRFASFVFSLALAACGSPAEGPTPSATSSSGSPPAAAAAAAEPAAAAAPPLDPARAVAVARGSGFGCALRANGRVACWGSNTGGELGQGHTDPVEGAREVVGLDDAVAIAAAQRVGCAVRQTGGVVCWGSARAGELGDARETSSGGRLVSIPGVEGADAVFAWLTRVCARTRGGMWCWGSVDSRVDGAALAGQRSAPPHRIALEDVDHLRLGGRNYAFLRAGGALTWDYREGPTALPDVVEALSISGSELRVMASGEVTLTTTGSSAGVTTTQPALASVHTLAANSYVYFGLRPDGSLAAQGRDGTTQVVDGATDLAALVPGEGTPTALTRDGRVLEFRPTDSTGLRYVAHVIELPPSGAPAAPPSQAEGPIPAWCEVELRVVLPESVSSVQAACAQLPVLGDEPCPAVESETRRVLCGALSVNAPSCADGGPIWVLGDTSEVALVWSAGAGLRLLRELAPVNAGTEDASTVERAELRSLTPLEALLEVSTAEEACDGEGDDELCGQSETGRRFALLRELRDGTVLQVDVRVDRSAMNAARGSLGAAPRVTLAAAEVTVEACGGRATRPLPRAEPPAASAAPAVSAPASVPTAADVERAAARCSTGWTRFGEGDLQAARTELEAALTQLAGVADERGRRALGACRYNLGRVEEAEGHVDAARQLYRLSLEVRPNPAVEARLTSLAGR